MSTQPQLIGLIDRPRPEVTFGVVQTHEDGWLIDAQPFVMTRVRNLFRNGRSAWNCGKFTHNPVILPKTPDSGKDLLWLLDRHPLDVGDDVWHDLTRYSERYDRALAAAAVGDSNHSFDLSHGALQMAKPPYWYQAGYVNLVKTVRRILNADWIGGGKSVSLIATLCEPDARPALIVCQPHLTLQFREFLNEFLPDATVQVLKTGMKKEIKPVDVVIVGYTGLRPWQDVLVPYPFRSICFDEIQDLRHLDTEKRRVSIALSERADFVTGYSATPIYNYGSEIWSILDVLSPGCLGAQGDFKREWCTGDRVNSPAALNSYLKSRGLMIRRTAKDVKGSETKPQKQTITLEGDMHTLRQVQDVAKALAMSVLSNRVGESEKSARELDWKLRHATGVAKAKPAAEFVKMLCESGEKVLLFGWHREVYDIWKYHLKNFNPVLCTGSETPAQKQAAKDKFLKDGSCQVFICSLRSGAGIDGLQDVCHLAVFGELDWSPQVLDQCIGRLRPELNKEEILAYFLTIDDGADPFMIERLGDKRSQSDGIIDGKDSEGEILEDGPPADRIRQMAEAYLMLIGEEIPVAEPQSGLHAEVASALRKINFPRALNAKCRKRSGPRYRG